MDIPANRLPAWLRAKPARPGGTHAVRARLRAAGLHTVCEEARCPNAGECFGAGKATFLILGDACTRACTFCAVGHAAPAAADPDEPSRVAETAAGLGLRHVVITSVTRDDLADGGAGQFASCIKTCRGALPDATIEVLIPDFGGDEDALNVVLAAGPDVLNHNIETVRGLYPRVRPQAGYDRSLELLARAAAFAGPTPAGRVRSAAVETPAPALSHPTPVVKSGLMVGLGETRAQLSECFRDLRHAGVEILTMGQYLRPRRSNIGVARYYEPAEFGELAAAARAAGIPTVVAAPLVRSSYHAAGTLGAARRGK